MKRAVIKRTAQGVQRALLMPEGLTFVQIDISDDGKELYFVIEHATLEAEFKRIGMAEKPELPVIEPVLARIDNGVIILRDWGLETGHRYWPKGSEAKTPKIETRPGTTLPICKESDMERAIIEELITPKKPKKPRKPKVVAESAPVEEPAGAAEAARE